MVLLGQVIFLFGLSGNTVDLDGRILPAIKFQTDGAFEVIGLFLFDLPGFYFFLFLLHLHLVELLEPIDDLQHLRVHLKVGPKELFQVLRARIEGVLRYQMFAMVAGDVYGSLLVGSDGWLKDFLDTEGADPVAALQLQGQVLPVELSLAFQALWVGRQLLRDVHHLRVLVYQILERHDFNEVQEEEGEGLQVHGLVDRVCPRLSQEVGVLDLQLFELLLDTALDHTLHAHWVLLRSEADQLGVPISTSQTLKLLNGVGIW
eukprot:CAMPEP_0170561216 /NCGR_PEP_ID=MMETSP0211-20121228/53381_1 /TAXON_ID=311385 /ORGANISM="Pseudokeronopsis sp., Strain OXSARD2" /LENGTH=260 /DNA_ID=CAMNT_0010876447 /DNA_START=198 /DNA_END=977 /DNA_ORIENTATION=+